MVVFDIVVEIAFQSVFYLKIFFFILLKFIFDISTSKKKLKKNTKKIILR